MGEELKFNAVAKILEVCDGTVMLHPKNHFEDVAAVLMREYGKPKTVRVCETDKGDHYACLQFVVQDKFQYVDVFVLSSSDEKIIIDTMLMSLGVTPVSDVN